MWLFPYILSLHMNSELCSSHSYMCTYILQLTAQISFWQKVKMEIRERSQYMEGEKRQMHQGTLWGQWLKIM